MKTTLKKMLPAFKMYLPKFLFISICLMLLANVATAQISISSTTAVTEDFDAMGTSAIASLPSYWKMSPAQTLSPIWSSASNFTATSQAASGGTPATGGRYNWGRNGTTDRSIGFISSMSYKSPNSVMAWYRNAGSDNILSLTISYDLYQFRIFNPATVTFHYSTDGSIWIPFSAGDAQAITSDVVSSYNFSNPNNFGRSAAAGTTAFTISGLSIPVGGDIYLRWAFTTPGSSSSPGLGLDNVSVTATFCSATNVTGFAVTPGNGRLSFAWTNPTCYDEILIVAALNPITTVPSGDGSAYTANNIYAAGNSGNGLNTNEFAVYKGTSTGVLVTGMNNGTTYYVKIFTRRGTTWSSGVTGSGMPFAPFTGDFRSKSNGNWTDYTIWEKYSGGSWLPALSNEFPNKETSNVIIQSGHTVILNGAGPYTVNSLTIESSGKVYTGSTAGTSTTYISVYGNITCDGTIGNNPTPDDIGFTIEADGNCTISGSGSFTCSRIRKQWTTGVTSLTINMDISTRWSINSNTQLYNYSSGTFNVTISSGVNFTCYNVGNVAIDGVSGNDAAQRKGTLNVYGTLTIPGILYLTTNNTKGNGVTVNIRNGGVINAASIVASASGSVTHTLRIYNGGKLNITGAAGWSSFSATNNNYILDAGSTIEYSYAGNQTIETGIGNYANLTCSGGGVKTQNGNLTVDEALSISAGTLSIGSNTLTLNGSITGSGTLTGSSTSNLTLGGSGSSIGTLNFTAGSQMLNLLTVNRTVTGQYPAAIMGNDLDVNSLTLSNGILATGYNLLTWSNSGGTLTASESSYTPNSTDYTKSFIATCDDLGTPINIADEITAFTGNAGFQIKNVGNTDTYFPVGASYLPAMTGQVASPNRMMINNLSSATHDFTVAVNYGDIGYTNGLGGALKVNRIWYVNRPGSNELDSATMQLFFTKRDWTGWGTTENEVEQGFSYFQPALVHKDYSGNGTAFINLSSGGDIHDFSNAGVYPYNTEIYGIYTIGISKNKTNGIQQFNRFSVVNPGDIVLPISIVNFKAYQKDYTLQINWTALNETNVDRYEIQHSTNGTSFTTVASISAMNTGSSTAYRKTDPAPSTGNNFYRIKIVDKNGKISYTQIINVPFNSSKTGVDVYPNPVVNAWCVLQLNNLPKAQYNLTLYTADGKLLFSKKIQHEGGTASETIQLPTSISAGKYFMQITNGETRYTKSLFIAYRF